jgi:geranylgeranyl pyrophosphate synthase
MSWSADVLSYIRAHPFLAGWPDAKLILDSFEPKLRISLPTALPLWTCYAAGGKPESAMPLGAAFALLHMASSVLDDFQDQDTEDPWVSWSLERVLGSTLAMVFLSESCLARLDTNEVAKREIIDGFAEGWMLAAVGQNSAVSSAQPVDSYWRHALAKSSLGFAVAAWSGVRIVTADAKLQQAAKDYGLALGTLLQIADDCHDFVAAPKAQSPSALLASLPVVIASEETDHPSHAELSSLLKADGRPLTNEWATSVCSLVTAMGGLTKAAAIGTVYELKAVAALSAFDPTRVNELAEYARAIFSTTAE